MGSALRGGGGDPSCHSDNEDEDDGEGEGDDRGDADERARNTNDPESLVRGRSGSTSDHTITSSMNSFPLFANPNLSMAETELGQVSIDHPISLQGTCSTLTLASPSVAHTTTSSSPSANLPSLRRMRVARSPLPSLVLGETLTQQPDRVWGRNTKHLHDLNPYPHTLTSSYTPTSKPLSVHTYTSKPPSPPPSHTYTITASQAAAIAEASVRTLTSFELLPTTSTTYQEDSRPDLMMNSGGNTNGVEIAALNFIRQRGQVDVPSDEGKGELLDSPYHHSGSGSGGGLCYTPYVGGKLTSSESALVQEI